MVPAKRKDRVGHRFFGQSDILVGLEFVNHLVQRHRPLDLEVKPDAMHVLRVQLNRRGKEIEIEARVCETGARHRARDACQTGHRYVSQPLAPQ